MSTCQTPTALSVLVRQSTLDAGHWMEFLVEYRDVGLGRLVEFPGVVVIGVSQQRFHFWLHAIVSILTCIEAEPIFWKE